MNKKILFRADGNEATGLGHLYRLFALIEMLKEVYNCKLLVSSSTISQVIPTTYPCVKIPKGISIEDEPQWLFKNYDSNEHIIIADGYQFNSTYQKQIKELGYNLIYIDDLANEHMFADIVVNHSLGIKTSDFKYEPYTKFALGTEYSILRPSFIKEAKSIKNFKKIESVFICFGGSDFYDLTYKCLLGIINKEPLNEFHVVLGGAYSHSTIYELAKNHKNKVFLHENVLEKDMLAIMNKCQIAIVPSSTISYEVCSAKMIVLSGYYIDNQINIYNGFVNKGVIYNGGDFTKYSTVDFEKQINEIITNPDKIHKKMLSNQHDLFDGNQKKRYIKLLKSLK